MLMDKATPPGGLMLGFVAWAVEYMMDEDQRSVILMDVLRRRGGQYREPVAQAAPYPLQHIGN